METGEIMRSYKSKSWFGTKLKTRFSELMHVFLHDPSGFVILLKNLLLLRSITPLLFCL